MIYLVQHMKILIIYKHTAKETIHKVHVHKEEGGGKVQSVRG